MDSLCGQCAALCCRYIALPIKEPKDRQSCDEARWFLMHDGVTVFRSKGQWYASIATPCRHLTEDHRCGIYERRPEICREYSDNGCDYHGGEYEYELFFTHPDQMDQYARRILAEGTKKRPGRKRAR